MQANWIRTTTRLDGERSVIEDVVSGSDGSDVLVGLPPDEKDFQELWYPRVVKDSRVGVWITVVGVLDWHGVGDFLFLPQLTGSALELTSGPATGLRIGLVVILVSGSTIFERACFGRWSAVVP